ncbi:Z1 domain-containing protein [Treponema putidum]|uniref:Putative endonuclease Z1 domain-containing protein n=1 Tax=Treponema putidum TaxID=221027 RepID=A0ABY5HVY1_9SPIR|nr:Z1 domain-containing protein [Treponema putidum]AIN93343.1 hypothetical protein JO40_03770 [Treponema putidum]TWI72955.1 Z1 domain-containing protein [Treponema putidum]UTY29584.1 hypothetical protein E4N76_11880 [Treponema putidum]
MKFLEHYINSIKYEETKQTILNVTGEIFEKHLADYNYQSNVNGLLLGEVQSGKTGQMFGVVAAAADRDFKIFIVLTTDNKRLQEQTFKRALDVFSEFCICGENDELRFKMNKMRKPVIIVLKKNTSILKKWRNIIINSKFLDGRSLFIIDDEADAASLNTKINKNEVSTINRNIADIRNTAVSCIYLQVTATPQAVLLQTDGSEFKPEFIIYFPPGKAYLGGDFFFSKPESYCIRYVNDEEIKDIKKVDTEISEGLASAVLNFLIVCAHIKLSRTGDACNFLIHPSVRIHEHQIIAEKIGEFLNDLLQNTDDTELKKNFEDEWKNLYTTKPEIKKFPEIYVCIKDLLFNTEIDIITLNSKSDAERTFDTGFNIVVGGNTLGRGVTFPNLQTVYYSRTAKVPQADTFWQHCRMFGYDRDRALIRLFMPPFIHKLFQELNNSQAVLIKHLTEHGLENNQLMYIDGIRPTRKNVIKSSCLRLITGGVNYFSAFPINSDLDKLDNLLSAYTEKSVIDVPLHFIEQLLSNISSEDNNDWNSINFINAIRMISKSENNNGRGKLLVRRDRNISKGTGTMLSPDDRNTVSDYSNDVFLVMYRLTGEARQGWSGKPFWMPNIRLPDGFVFYKME